MLLAFLLVVLAGTASAQSEENEVSPEVLQTALMPPNDSGAYATIRQLPEWVRRSAPYARSYYEFERVAGTSGVYDWDKYFEAYKQAQADWKRETSRGYKSTAPRPLSNWRNIGVTGTTATAFSAGCTVAIAFDPTNADIMYVGAQGGGVWKSMDHGASWVPLTDYALPNMTVASVAVDPHSPSTVWVGTGECNAGEPNYGGSGLWRSKNGGADWEKIDLKTSGIGQSFVKVLVDPGSSNVVFASSYDGNAHGLYRSEDGGTTWSRVFTTSGVVWDLVAGKIESQQTYFLIDGGNQFAPSGKGGIYKSVDDGKTWTRDTSSVIPSGNKIGRSVLAVASGDQNKVFALMSNISTGDSLALVMSSDAGGSWTEKQLPAYLFKSSGASTFTQGWYDICMTVHPSGLPIYIGGVQAFVDYGQGWQMWSGYGDQMRGNPHVDHHALALDPRNSNTVFAGTDGGLYMSTDGGHAWAYRSNNMVTNRIYRIAFERVNQSAVWAGAQDQGTWRLGLGNDSAFFGGDGFQPITYPVSTSIIYYELPNGNTWRSNNFRSGVSTELTSDKLCGDASNWDAPFKISIVGHAGVNSYDLLYVGRQNLWRTIDGTTFKKLTNISFGYPYITAIALSPINSDVLAVGGQGKIQISTDFGASWQNRSTSLPAAQTSSIVMTGRNPNFLLASFRTSGSNHVMVSTNFGTSWTSASGSPGNALPGVGVESVALDSTAPETKWYASTDVGVYYTADAGQTWNFASGLPIVACRDLQYQVRKDGNYIRVGTYGRGVWETSLPLTVSFTNLSAIKNDRGTLLKWTTGGDPDGGTFEIERSIGDQVFEKIGEIAAAGMRTFSFTDASTASGQYTFRVVSVAPSGTRVYSNIVEVTYGSNALIVHEPRPNPVVRGEANVSINYELPSRQPVSITIYSSTGIKVATLGSGEIREPGSYTEQWDGRDSGGNLMPAGTYLYEVTAGELGSFTGRISVR
jgi:photosystem II stability/assembly factor-like uncharacterized protein